MPVNTRAACAVSLGRERGARAAERGGVCAGARSRSSSIGGGQGAHVITCWAPGVCPALLENPRVITRELRLCVWVTRMGPGMTLGASGCGLRSCASQPEGTEGVWRHAKRNAGRRYLCWAHHQSLKGRARWRALPARVRGRAPPQLRNRKKTTTGGHRTQDLDAAKLSSTAPSPASRCRTRTPSKASCPGGSTRPTQTRR